VGDLLSLNFSFKLDVTGGNGWKLARPILVGWHFPLGGSKDARITSASKISLGIFNFTAHPIEHHLPVGMHIFCERVGLVNHAWFREHSKLYSKLSHGKVIHCRLGGGRTVLLTPLNFSD
jgi:hypothetical protein